MPVNPLPNYEVVPLRSDEVKVAVAQTTYRSVNPKNAKAEIKTNLYHMLRFIDFIQARRRRDLVCFHEFPLQGSDIRWTREEQLKVAIDVPGEETEIIGARAKQYNCYIEFGARARLKDWPGHFIYMGFIIGPDGQIVMQRWKSRNMAGIGFGTTVFDVLDRYVEMYGWDAVFPVARTDIGNLALAPCVYEPEAVRAYSVKGAELITRLMTIGGGYWSRVGLPAYRGGGFDSLRLDLQAGCMVNGVYGVFINHAVTPDRALGDRAAGASAIFDYDGRIMSEASSPMETIVIASIPMADYRRKHLIPNFPKELYTDMYQNYVPRFPPGALLDYLPKDRPDAVAYFKKLARW